VTVPGPDFGPAAKRHLADADLLHQHGRFANACHLAGFAAECALKAIALAFLGAQPKTTGPPEVTIAGQNTSLSHLPDLWTHLSLLVNGRSGSMFVSLLQRPNPFAMWSIHERYHRGTGVTATRSSDHISAARSVVSLYQQAQLAGSLP